MIRCKKISSLIRKFCFSLCVVVRICCLSCCLYLISCNESPKQTANSKADTTPGNIEITAATIAGNFSTQSSLKVDSSSLNPFFTEFPLLAEFKSRLDRFYSGRNFAFAWHDVEGRIEQADNLYNRLQNLPQEGIPGNVPYLGNLDSLMAGTDPKDEKTRLTTELMLTSLYFYFAEKVWSGIDENQTRKIDWFLPRKKVDYDRWLDTLLQIPGAFSKSEEPIYRQYHLLKKYLQKYNELHAKHPWEQLRAEKKSYRSGDSANILSEVRKRLYLLGDLPVLAGEAFFDSTLEAAVKSYQKRFGMKEDGIIGPQVMRELNTPLQKRVEQISVNMERSRWLPDAVKGNYLSVNIPAFKLYAYKDDSLLWDMNVVVGTSVSKTVVFSGDLKYVVFSPYWNVPQSILKSDILPGIRRDKNYLARHHMEWNGNSVRQKPGPWNSLGQVKFLFPNSYSIYLHDTPSKSLFEDDKRAFSHGCIRVAEPKKLAMHLLKNDSSWTEAKITRAMNSGKEQYVTLKENIPVFIAYFTAWVDRRGKINFRDDIYDRDDRLAEMLAK